MFLNCDFKSLKLYRKPNQSSYFLCNRSSLNKPNKVTMATSLTVSSNDLVLHKSSSSIEKLDDKFCGAFQEHYEYLMDEGLIETCQVSGTPSLTPIETENINANVSYKEFLHQFNQLKKWLEELQSFSFTSQTTSYCEKYTNQVCPSV